jgi:hypothetical protein
MNLVRTDIIDAVDRNGNVVAELDGGNPADAARKFAHVWRGGMIERVHDGEGATMTKDELDAISGHAWATQDGVRFKRRYYDGSKACHPEDNHRAYGIERTNVADVVARAVDNLSHKAWSNGMVRIEQETAKLEAELATTDADRYAKGLQEIEKLDAKDELKRRILAMKDPVARATMQAKYPELFDRDALSRMAQERSHAKHRK